MTTARRRVITARQVEDAARTPSKDFRYDPERDLVTPLARERANDLGVALTPNGSAGGRQPQPVAPAAAGDDPLDPTIVSEVIRRLRQRIGRAER